MESYQEERLWCGQSDKLLLNQQNTTTKPLKKNHHDGICVVLHLSHSIVIFLLRVQSVAEIYT